MLQEPMMEKLTVMRLLGMADALTMQEQDPAAQELSFLERLGLLVDQQWIWRENQALAAIACRQDKKMKRDWARAKRARLRSERQNAATRIANFFGASPP